MGEKSGGVGRFAVGLRIRWWGLELCGRVGSCMVGMRCVVGFGKVCIRMVVARLGVERLWRGARAEYRGWHAP